MALKKFHQFLEEKKAGKNGGDPAPKVKMAIVPDYAGKKSDSPPGGGKPYGTGKGATKEDSKAPKGEKNEEGLVDKGDKSLKYNPMTPYKGTIDLKPIKAERKTKNTSEAFVTATKGMSPTEYASFLSRKYENLGEIQAAVENFRRLVSVSPSAIMALVAESKRGGFYSHLMSEMLQHPGAMEIVAAQLGDKNEGMSAARRLAKAMNEMVGPPMHASLGGGSLGGARKKGLPAPGGHDVPPGGPMGHPDDDMGGHPDDDMGDDDDDMGGHPGDDDDDMGGHPGDDDDDDEMAHGQPDDDDDDDDDEMGGHPDDDDDDEMGGHPDDDGDDEMGGHPDDGPTQGGPGGGGGKSAFGSLKMPRPSMMHRMMRKESTSLAKRNLMKALKG